MILKPSINGIHIYNIAIDKTHVYGPPMDLNINMQFALVYNHSAHLSNRSDTLDSLRSSRGLSGNSDGGYSCCTGNCGLSVPTENQKDDFQEKPSSANRADTKVHSLGLSSNDGCHDHLK